MGVTKTRKGVTKDRQPHPQLRGGTDRLTDAACRAAQPPDAGVRKLADGKGLALVLMADGGRYWRMKYRHGGKERSISFGPYPDVKLAEARKRRDDAREWLRAGRDPIIERRVAIATGSVQQATTFAAVANEWLARQRYAEQHAGAQRQRLDDYLLPVLGALPVAEITTPVVLEALRRVERKGALETAAKTRQMAGQIFRYAIQTGRATTNPAADLRGAIKPPQKESRATIPLKEMPALFKALVKVPSEAVTKLAFYWVVLTACRTGEMRGATWSEIDGGDVWRIPAERMKMREPHVVPLSRQAQAVLRQARALRTSDAADALLFPGFTRHGALSENALLALLARAGYYGRQTGHGFRASFSTWAHEKHEANPDVIEACLAHQKPGVRGIYNRAGYVSQRLKLLQAWADACTKWGMKI
ncbi:MAG TPA: integrase arm-type DNA-binding domain-containing protein [Casimicrobiaceae bacterium]